MSIEFTCGGCGYSREVPNDFALKTVTCPKCKEKGLVPEPPLIAPMPPPFDLTPTRSNDDPPPPPISARKRRRGPSHLGGAIIFLFQLMSVPAYALDHSKGTFGSEMDFFSALLAGLAVIGFVWGPIWIAGNARGRGAETPLWCLVGMTPFFGIALYLVGNQQTD